MNKCRCIGGDGGGHRVESPFLKKGRKGRGDSDQYEEQYRNHATSSTKLPLIFFCIQRLSIGHYLLMSGYTQPPRPFVFVVCFTLFLFCSHPRFCTFLLYLNHNMYSLFDTFPLVKSFSVAICSAITLVY